MRLMVSAMIAALLWSSPAWADDVDTDGDGLSDFREIHKHFTDPKKPDSDGDGKPDGDWDERREYAYTIRTVVRVMPPYNKAHLTDDYQDARVRKETDEYIELEVVHYPLNRVAEGIEAQKDWRMAAFVAQPDDIKPGITTNWDDAMRERVLAELDEKGIDARKMTDRAFVEAVALWLVRRARSSGMFCTYFVGFEDGKPRVLPGCERNFLAGRGNSEWSTEQQFAHELFGKSMFENETRGTCTSSAIYLTTALRAAGVPTRMIVAIPLIDASDPKQVEMVDKCITHHEVRRIICAGVQPGSTSFNAHTFNEVWVGGRWRRLNYEKLGDNILNPRYMGLMTHVHTFRDLSEAKLGETWGMRYAKGARSEVFPFSNPYRTLEVSDRFGRHAAIPNPEPEGGARPCGPPAHKTLTVAKAYWEGSADMPPGLKGSRVLGPKGAGVFYFHAKEWFSNATYVQYRPFRDKSDPNVVLKAEGLPNVFARATGYFFTSGDGSEREFRFVLERSELAKMKPGVAYSIHPKNDSAYKWQVADGVRLVRM